MATAINTAALTGSSLDVKNIVNQLMQVERRPIEALQSRLDNTGVRITALGNLQSKFSALQDAVELLQTPDNFKQFSTSSSNSSVLGAAAGSDAVPGLYEVDVQTLASASRFALIQPGSQSQAGDYEIGLSIDGQARAFSFSASSLTDLQSQIEANTDLRGRVSLALIDSQRGFLQGLETGAAKAVTLKVNNVVQTADVAAGDARLTVGGLDVQNAENRFEVLGLDLNLLDTGISRVTVRRERVDASGAIDNLISAYNQMLAEYRLQTASSVETAERGVLNSDSTLSGIVQQINQLLRGPFSGAGGSSQGLADLGLEFSRTGQLVRMNGATVSATQLSDRLADGLVLGPSGSDNLANFIEQTLSFGGALSERVEAEKSMQRDLLDKQSLLEEKMLEIERRYTSQYAALDALLFRLNTTSSALKSALDALTASMKND
jgi:flagellar hook-associated protein 2